jgi:hypothetical protein
MRTLKAVVAGFVVASALILAGGWAFGMVVSPAMRGGYYSPNLGAGLIALLYSGAAVIIGSYVATRVHDSNETTSGFAVVQVFFGFGLIREFWSTGSSWYTVFALLLVIPCAIAGRAVARRSTHRQTPRTA